MDGRGVLKSTLTMLSVLGERMKAREPRRSPCGGHSLLSHTTLPRHTWDLEPGGSGIQKLGALWGHLWTEERTPEGQRA